MDSIFSHQVYLTVTHAEALEADGMYDGNYWPQLQTQSCLSSEDARSSFSARIRRRREQSMPVLCGEHAGLVFAPDSLSQSACESAIGNFEMAGGQGQHSANGRDPSNSLGHQSLSQAVIGLNQSPSKALRSPRQAKRRTILPALNDSQSQEQLGSQKKYVYGDPDAGALSQLSDIITLESSQQGPNDQRPPKSEAAPAAYHPDSVQGSLPHLSQDLPDGFALNSQPGNDFDHADQSSSQACHPGMPSLQERMPELPAPGEALANALRSSRAPDWQHATRAYPEEAEQQYDNSHLPDPSSVLRNHHACVSNQPMVPTSLHLPQPGLRYTPAGSNSDLTGMQGTIPASGYPSTADAAPTKAKSTRRGPMDEMRQLVRILVKLIPHSVEHIANSEEGGGGNRISEEQIKIYLDSTLGEAPRPTWGIPNGWGDYVAGNACLHTSRRKCIQNLGTKSDLSLMHNLEKDT